MGKYKSEAVISEMTKRKGNRARCRLRPAAGGSAIEIGGIKYLVARKASVPGSGGPIKGILWRLNKAGATRAEFILTDGLQPWALAAWQGQRKVRLVLKGKSITKIRLL